MEVSKLLVIPEYLTIKTAAGATAAFLSPSADGLKECYIDNELNGSCTLTFSIPTTSDKKQYLTEAYRIYAPDSTGTLKEFVILTPDSIDRTRDGKKVMGKITAQESWVRLGKEYVDPGVSNDPQTPSPPALAVIVLSGGSDLSGGLYTVGSAAHALYAILQGTGWTVGTADQTGTHDLETEKISVLANIQKIQEIWGGYLVWDSVNKTVSLRDETTWAPYTGYQIRYAKNLKGITRTSDFDIVTKLYPFGEDDLNIGSVNGGVIYLTNNTYTAEVLEGIYTNQDKTTAQELKDDATKYLSKICRPRHNYRIDQVDLRTLSGYTHESFDVGHMVDIKDEELDTDDQARVIRHRFNVFQPWICELEVGDPLDTDAKLMADSQITVKYLNGIKNSKGQITAYKLVPESIIAEKIAKAAVDATKLNTKVVVLMADTWADNSPAPGSVAWNQHKLYYAGVEHVITAGNTAQKYIYWDGVANTYSASADMPTLTDGQFIVAVNNGGLHDTVWDKGYAREFIGSVLIAQAAILSAHIAELQVLSGHIANLDANKINVTDLTALSSEDGYTQMKGDGVRVYNDIAQLMAHIGKFEALGPVVAAFTRATPTYKSDGTQVASGVPRYETAPSGFGQQLYIDRACINLLGADGNFEIDSNSDGIPDGWEFYNSPSYISLATDRKWAGSRAVKVSCDNTGGGSAITPAGRSTARNATAGQKYAASGKVYIESSSLVGSPAARLYIWFENDAGGAINALAVTANNLVTDQWQTISVLLQAGVGATKVKTYGPYVDVPAGAKITCWYDAVQIEQYPHSTTYCDTSRNADVLTVPTASILSTSQGTIEFYFEVNEKTQVSGASAKYLISHATSGTAGPGGSYPNAIGLYMDNNSIDLYTCDNSGSISLITWPTVLAQGRHKFSIAFDSTELVLRVDGVRRTFVANPKLPSALASTFTMGGWAYSTGNEVCGSFADLRVSNIKRSDAEDLEQFNSGLPLLLDANTTLKMGFDGTLQQTVRDFGLWTKNGRFILMDPQAGQGIEVWDGAVRKVLVGRLDDGTTIGMEIVGGKLYSSEVRTGGVNDTTYIALEPPNGLTAYYEGNKTFELMNALYRGYLNLYNTGVRKLTFDTFGSESSIESTQDLLIHSSNNITVNATNEAHIYVGTGKYCLVHGNFDTVGGVKDAVQKTANYGWRRLAAREGPDVRLIIEGWWKFTNGECRIDIDPMFIECIEPHTEQTLWTFSFAPMFEFMDICVSEIGDTYFVVKEKNGSNGQFSCWLSAIRNGYAGRWMEQAPFDDETVLDSGWEDELGV